MPGSGGRVGRCFEDEVEAELVAAALALLVYLTQVGHTEPRYCFVVEGGRILCAPTPDACEKLRERAGASAGRCQKVTPTSP